MDGRDENTTTPETLLAEETPGGVALSTLKPEDLGISRCSIHDLRGGDAAANATIIRSILGGENGPRRDIVLINAAYALLAADRATTPQQGLAMAAEALDRGKAMVQLDKLVELTKDCTAI
jgi:anthranilate phosphoribosyltransferase